MLSVYGVCIIPEDNEVKAYKSGSGVSLYFRVVSPDKFSKERVHEYKVNLWIPQQDVDDWKEKIQPGSVFFIENGEWLMRTDQRGYSRPLLKIFHSKFRKFSANRSLDE